MRVRRSGSLLIETLFYVALSALTITLLFQLAWQIYTQTKMQLVKQTASTNLMVVGDLLRRDLQQLALNLPAKQSDSVNLDYLALASWRWRGSKLYRQHVTRPVCLLENVQNCQMRLTRPKLVEFALTVKPGATLQRIVYLRNLRNSGAITKNSVI